MAKKEWTTQQRLATELGITVQAVHNWIRRKDKRITHKLDSKTGVTLVCYKKQ